MKNDERISPSALEAPERTSASSMLPRSDGNGVRIHVRQCQMTEDVRALVERLGFATHAPRDGVIEAHAPEGMPLFVARLELRAYLALWRAANEPYEAIVRE